MKFGLTPEQHAILISLLKKHLPRGRAIIYGSRAKGVFAPQSDVDLVLQSAGDDRHLLANLRDDIDESDFPFLCDIHYIEEIKNPRLLAHIQRVGKVLYE